MEILDLLGSAISVGSGGLLGGVASLVGSWLKSRQLREDREWQLERMTRMAELGIREADTEGKWQGLVASLEAEASLPTNVHPLVAGIKSLFRPMLTTGLWVLAAWTFNEVLTAMVTPDHPLANVFSVQEMKDIIRYMIYTIFFTASTSAAWWFGDRAFAPPYMK